MNVERYHHSHPAHQPSRYRAYPLEFQPDV